MSTETAPASRGTAQPESSGEGHEAVCTTRRETHELVNALEAGLNDLDIDWQELETSGNALDAHLKALEADRKAVAEYQRMLDGSRRDIKVYEKMLKADRKAVEADWRFAVVEQRLSKLIFVNIAVTCAMVPVGVALMYYFRRG